MTNKLIISAVLLATSFSVFAAKEIRTSEMASMKEKIGVISVDVRGGTIDEALRAVSKEADEKGASYFHITSIGNSGMGSDVSATAEIYK
ncbi:DUF1471 domain-containing protein [Serratia proteamaculans]|uniref:DUF1471 domain-containing protein n=1 Tax=Serratia proteamaculans TaxID=28151 RepID=UPI0015770725|nr:DUF1471 domain-containing protein [Serratia proteamaculans]NTX77438.1 DUF1471 domain-containing protein [Serratia proteamaculans]NTZ28319.1 DUF1471 domain-containing protein [Serratia proteamaculans]